MKKRFLPILLVLVMVLTLLPSFSALATPEEGTDFPEDPIAAPESKDFYDKAGVRYQEIFKMIYVEGGDFTLGWQRDDQYSSAPHSPFDTAPVAASVSDFYIAETEVTQGLYNAVMNTNAPNNNNRNMPRNTVSFYDVQTFLGRLYVLTGKVYRLATEAEWEFAAKGGNPGKALGHDNYLYSGSDIASEVAHTGNSASVVAASEETRGKLVGNTNATRQPNILGIYDMSGNIEEWVWNPWNSTIVGGQDPIGVNSPVHAQRTRRGGAYQGENFSRYSTARQIRSIDGGDPLLGFRIALSADQSSCPWERVGLPKPFDIRHPVIDDRYEPNTYRDHRLITGDDKVWDGDFVGIFGGATMKLWETGEAVIIPHNLDGSDPNPIIGQWYTTLDVALVIVPEEAREEWQINPHDGVQRLTITYTFLTPDMFSCQNDRTSVFQAPFGKMEIKNEEAYQTQINNAADPEGAHQGSYSIIEKPVLNQALVATEDLTAGEGPVASNHLLWDMSQLNDSGNIEEAARGKDERLLDGPDAGWWMGYGAGGEHTYRKDFDINSFRFGVYSPAFGTPTQTEWGPKYYFNMIVRGDWYTVNDVLLVVLNNRGIPSQHYIYLVAPDMQWEARNEANAYDDDGNYIGTDIYTKENAENNVNPLYVLARSPLESPATYPLRHLSLQNQERGDQRLLFHWPNTEVQYYWEEIPTGNPSSIFPSTFRMPIAREATCPGIPSPSSPTGRTTCGGTVYTCSCPIFCQTHQTHDDCDESEFAYVLSADREAYTLGSTVTVSVYLTSTTQKSVTAFDFSLNFNSDILQYVATEGIDGSASVNSGSVVALTRAGASIDLPPEGLLVAKITFRAFVPGEASFSIAIGASASSVLNPSTGSRFPANTGNKVITTSLEQVDGVVSFIENNVYNAAPAGYKVMKLTLNSAVIPGATYLYDNGVLLWSEKYGSYVTMVQDEVTLEGAYEIITAVIEAGGSKNITITYDGDIITTTGLGVKPVNAYDAQAVWGLYMGLYPNINDMLEIKRFGADITGDGIVDMFDVLAIQQIALALI